MKYAYGFGLAGMIGWYAMLAAMLGATGAAVYSVAAQPPHSSVCLLSVTRK